MMRFGAGILRFGYCLSVIGGLLLATGHQAVALSDPEVPPEEGARLALIDYCVLQESGKHGQNSTYVNTCKCATNRVLKEMNQDEMKGVAKWKKPTSAVKNRWESAWEGCK